jgi:glutamate N-acetyltransferase / amino-acid N-acetyltransferase
MGKITKVSPLAPESFPDLPVIEGVMFAAAQAGVRYQGRTDVMLAQLVHRARTMAGVFTRSATRSAPVLDCQAKIGADSHGRRRDHRQLGQFQCVHRQRTVSTSTRAVTSCRGRRAGPARNARVFSSSTGVIGEPLAARPDHSEAFRACRQTLDKGAIAAAARAIMTTDTFAKRRVCRDSMIGGKTVEDRRHRQRLGHDRARYGDDAGLHLHRCRRRPVRASGHADGTSLM